MSSFTDLAGTFLKEEFAESPVLASSLGLTEYDERLRELLLEESVREVGERRHRCCPPLTMRRP